MAMVRDEHKAKLKEMGLWGDFCLFRDDLEEQGVDGATANREAVRKFLGNEAAEHPGQSWQRKKNEKKKRLEAVGVILPKSRTTLELVPLESFEGRQATEGEVIRWVARYMGVADVKVEECPDPAAWSLLAACRRSPAFEGTFWQTMYTKIVPRTVDEEKGVDIDGTPTIDLIDRIRAVREKALGIKTNKEETNNGQDAGKLQGNV